MSEDQFYMILQQLGDDAKTIAILYLFLDYGGLFLIVFLVTWGIRNAWLPCGTERKPLPVPLVPILIRQT